MYLYIIKAKENWAPIVHGLFSKFTEWIIAILLKLELLSVCSCICVLCSCLSGQSGGSAETLGLSFIKDNTELAKIGATSLWMTQMN